MPSKERVPCPRDPACREIPNLPAHSDRVEEAPRPARFRRGLVVFALYLGLSLAAAGADPEGWAYTVSNDLMSPFCPGRTLAECPSPQADELRLWIIVQEAAGRSQADVEEELYARFGEVLRSAPEVRGIGIAAYALPIAVFVGGGLLVAGVLRRITTKPVVVAEVAPSAAAISTDSEFERLIDEERRA